jgi:hypothetical protein
MGVLVLPGQYTLVLTANGQTYRRELEVAADPRVHISQADLEEQLRVERVASAAMDASYEAFSQARILLEALKNTLKQIVSASQNTSAAAPFNDLEKKVGEIANHEHTDLGFGPANRELARLFEMISSGDARPAAPLIQGVEDACRNVSARLAQWQEINRKDTPGLNSGATRLPVAGSIPKLASCQ